MGNAAGQPQTYYCENSLLNKCSTDVDLKQRKIDSTKLQPYTSQQACLTSCSVPKELTGLITDYADNITAYELPTLQQKNPSEEYKASKQVHDIKVQLDRLHLYLAKAVNVDLLTAGLNEYKDSRFLIAQLTTIENLWKSGKGFIGFVDVVETLLLTYGYVLRISWNSRDRGSVNGKFEDVLRLAFARPRDPDVWFRMLLRLMKWRKGYNYFVLTGWFAKDCVPSEFYDAKDIAAFASDEYKAFIIGMVETEGLEWKQEIIKERKHGDLEVLADKIFMRWRNWNVNSPWEAVVAILPFNVMADVWNFMQQEENRSWPFNMLRSIDYFTASAQGKIQCAPAAFAKAVAVGQQIETESNRTDIAVNFYLWAEVGGHKITFPTRSLCNNLLILLAEGKRPEAIAGQIIREYNLFCRANWETWQLDTLKRKVASVTPDATTSTAPTTAKAAGSVCIFNRRF
jgi:hypothetical protein